jgi:hypothetical protein
MAEQPYVSICDFHGATGLEKGARFKKIGIQIAKMGQQEANREKIGAYHAASFRGHVVQPLPHSGV